MIYIHCVVPVLSDPPIKIIIDLLTGEDFAFRQGKKSTKEEAYNCK